MTARRLLRGRQADVALAGALVAGTVAYLVALPRVLGESDEGLFLYEAKRLLEGEVFYRDFFDIITPGAHYLMAASFALLGADMSTARFIDAATHAAIVGLVYAIARRLGVRRILALAAALTHPVVLRPAWTVASPHWVTTCLALALLYVLLGRPRPVAAGAVAGLAIAVQQQKGMVLAGGAAILLAADPLLRGSREVVRPLVRFAAGLALVLVPLAAVLTASAGVRPVFRALVLHPLVNYGPWHHTGWGALIFPRHPGFVFPRALPLLVPAIVALVGLRAAGELLGGVPRERVRRSLVLFVMLVAAIGATLYFPDYIHLAFIAPLCAVGAADLLEAALAWLEPRSRVARLVGVLVPVLLAGGVAVQGYRFAIGSWRAFPVPYASAFGRVQVVSQDVADILDELRAALRASESGELFVYPFGASLYLLTGARNPTRYQLLLPGYSTPDQLADAVESLERRRVPLVLAMLPLQPGRVVDDYVLSRYEPVQGKVLLYRRRRESSP